MAAAGRGDQLAQFLGGGLLARVNPLELADELGGDPAAGLAGGVALPDPTGRGRPGVLYDMVWGLGRLLHPSPEWSRRPE